MIKNQESETVDEQLFVPNGAARCPKPTEV